MTILGKKQMSEEDIKLNYITPVILDGWKGHVTMETKITDGRINISGNKAVLSSHHIAPFVFAMTTDKHVIDILQGYTDESPWLSAVLKDNCT